MKKQFFNLILIFFLASCSCVDFDSPMPKGIKPMQGLNSVLIGKYYYSDSTLNIDNKTKFYNAKYFENAFTSRDSVTLISAEVIMSEKQIVYMLDGINYYEISKFDTARIIKKHEKAIKTIMGKYISFKEKITIDTLLNLNNNKDKLIYFNGKYYLNHFVRKNDWAIFQFEKKQNDSSSINLTDEEDYNKLIDLTRSHQPILFKFSVVNLSNKKFKDFVAKGGFRAKFGLRKYATETK